MPFKTNETYIALRNFTTYDVNDNPVRIEKNSTYVCDWNKDLVDQTTGEVIAIKNHVSFYDDWYFKRKNSVSSSMMVPNRNLYVQTLLRFGDGLDLDALYEIAEDESFGPIEKKIPRNAFSQCLTVAVATGRFEMRKDGVLVEGVGHNKKNCTFHIVPKKVA